MVCAQKPAEISDAFNGVYGPPRPYVNISRQMGGIEKRAIRWRKWLGKSCHARHPQEFMTKQGTCQWHKAADQDQDRDQLRI
jgi:hypothetical protein